MHHQVWKRSSHSHSLRVKFLCLLVHWKWFWRSAQSLATSDWVFFMSSTYLLKWLLFLFFFLFSFFRCVSCLKYFELLENFIYFNDANYVLPGSTTLRLTRQNKASSSCLDIDFFSAKNAIYSQICHP